IALIRLGGGYLPGHASSRGRGPDVDPAAPLRAEKESRPVWGNQRGAEAAAVVVVEEIGVAQDHRGVAPVRVDPDHLVIGPGLVQPHIEDLPAVRAEGGIDLVAAVAGETRRLARRDLHTEDVEDAEAVAGHSDRLAVGRPAECLDPGAQA